MTDKDKVLSVPELQRCMSDEVKIAKLSKLICKHSSEWNMSQNFDTFKQEIEAIYAKGIEQEEEEGQRQDLETARDEKIALLKEKIEKLSFWDKIQDGPVTKKTTDTSKKEEPSRFSIMQETTALKQAQHKKKQEAKVPKRTFPVSNDNVYHFHPIAFVEHMKLITAPKYDPDHGDFHDPLVNPQVRGWYNMGSVKNKDSAISGWNPYGSLKYAHKDDKASDGSAKYEYGRAQRGGNSHSGVDLYAPVGTPIYACVDGKITYHDMFGKKAGYLTQLTGTYKGKTYTFQYLHLMEIKSDKFRFYNNYKNDPKIVNDGWKNYSGLKTPLIDPIVGESYNVNYNGSELTIDNNIIDIDLGASIKKGDTVKKGQIIGYTGSTGNSYQGKKRNHLHFGIKDDSGNRISPYELFDEYINLDESGVETSSKQDGETPSSEW